MTKRSKPATAPASDAGAESNGATASTAPASDAAAEEPTEVKARVLIDGLFGKVNDVVVVDKAVADESGDLDAHPEAVAYAESLAEAE